jgi:RHS repeat-associated protein
MKSLVIFIILLIITIPVSFAEEVSIPKLFEVGPQVVSGPPGKEIYYYAGSKLIAVNEEYKYQDRLGSDVESRSVPFGQPLEIENRFSFTGKELDSELYYFNARYYDSNLGKFISVDPVRDNHAYSYVANNPMNFVDPTGMDLQMKLSFYDTDYDENVNLANNRLSELNDFFGKDLLSMDNEGFLSINGLSGYEGSEGQEKVLEVFRKLIDSDTNFEIVNQQEDGKSCIGACFIEHVNRILLSTESASYFKRPLGKNFENIEFTPLIAFVHEAAHAIGEGEKGAVEMGNLVREGTKRHFYGVNDGQMYKLEEGYMPPSVPKEYTYYLTPGQYDFVKQVSEDYNTRQKMAREIGTMGPRPELLMTFSEIYNF